MVIAMVGEEDNDGDDHCEQVIGPTASAGHYSVPRTSGEFSRDIISRSRSPRCAIITTILMIFDKYVIK